MTTVPKPTSMTAAYTCTYDSWNRLVEVKSGETTVGQITSFAYVHADRTFVVLACVDKEFTPDPGRVVIGARMQSAESAGKAEGRSLVELEALPRFPDHAERESWPGRYA